MDGNNLVALAESHIAALRTLLPEIKAASLNPDGGVQTDQYGKIFTDVKGLTANIEAPDDGTEEVEHEETDEATGAKRKVKRRVAKKK